MKYLAIGVLVIIILGGGYFFVLPNVISSLDTPNVRTSMSLLITSPVFEAQASVPEKFTCDGINTNPPLVISGIPEGTVSLALLMDDPDVPKAVRPDGMFDHWVVYSIPVAPGQTSVEISENSTPGIQGLNGRGQEAYTGPCPPPEYEPTEHRYFFKVYALSTELSFLAPPKKSEVESAMKDFIIESAELVGTYDRAKK